MFRVLLLILESCQPKGSGLSGSKEDHSEITFTFLQTKQIPNSCDLSFAGLEEQVQIYLYKRTDTHKSQEQCTHLYPHVLTQTYVRKARQSCAPITLIQLNKAA